MKWQEDEMLFMSVALEEGWTHKDIANELNRTTVAIKTKASRLNVTSLNNKKKSTEEYIAELPRDIVVLEPYINKYTEIKHKHLVCNHEWYISPTNILAGHSCPQCAGNKKKTTAEYIKQLPTDIILLDEYINNKTSIMHKHLTCGLKWTASPKSILTGRSCPNCSASFNSAIYAVTYLIYFPDYDLYKFGISNNYLRRFKQFGSKPEIILIREFDLGLKARELENKWSENVEHLKINTGLLKSGNTETFIY